MLEIGELIDGKYKILNQIGQGGMSVVYLAMNEKANKQWAIKEVRKDGIKDFEVVRQGLVTEIEMLKKFSHPNLPSIVDVIEDETRLLIVMDYIQGNPLSKALEEYGAQPQENVIIWAKQLCDVLCYLHTRVPPIIYRDMKPQNIMLKPDGNVSLIDFGTAREFKERNMSDTTCLGTVGYAAPEQFGGMGQTDARTDIYCFGATIYHLVTGQNPCEPPYEIKPIRQINPSLSSGLERIIQKCTKPNPEERYQSCAELMYALEHYEEIDDIFLAKQKKKLVKFSISAALTFVFAFVSVFGYVQATALQSKDYDKDVKDANFTAAKYDDSVKLMLNEGKDLAEAINMNDDKLRQTVDLYKNAIEIDPSRKEAYIDLIKWLGGKNGDENYPLTAEEDVIIRDITYGFAINKKNVYKNTIKTIETLKSKNRNDYIEVCYTIGLAYWNKFNCSADYRPDREWLLKAKAEWDTQEINNFDKETKGNYNIAKIYCEIIDCEQIINELRDSNRSKTSEIKKQTVILWTKLNELKKSAQDSGENDDKIESWHAITKIVYEEPELLLSVKSSEDINSLLDEIHAEAENLCANDSAVKNDIQKIDPTDGMDTVYEDIIDAKDRISAAASSN